jgi:hypothetical protein
LSKWLDLPLPLSKWLAAGNGDGLHCALIQADRPALAHWLMLRDGANVSFMCDLLYQRRNREDVTGMLFLKEDFLQTGFN